jgi:hypothetical protein
MDRFNPKKLSEMEGTEKYQIQITKRFTALGDDMGINTALETVIEYQNFTQRRSVL